jgi:spermidine/putrescine-binding protein
MARPSTRGAAAIALTAAALLAGCGGGEDTDAAAPIPADPSAPASGTLRTFTYSDTASAIILDPFRKQNPDLELKTSTFDSVQEGSAKLAGGFAADVVQVCSDEYQPLVTRGLLRPIDAAGIDAWDKLAFRDNEGVQTGDGDVNFVPIAAGPQGILYNTEEVEPAPDSWADLYDAAYAGRVSIDGGTWLTPIAETAMALGMENPMALSDEQVEEVKQHLIENRDQFRSFSNSDSDKLNLG